MIYDIMKLNNAGTFYICIKMLINMWRPIRTSNHSNGKHFCHNFCDSLTRGVFTFIRKIEVGVLNC